MYISKENLATDKNEIVAFMSRFSFAIIITAPNEQPVATHLPFFVSLKDDKIVLSAHFAKANRQWQSIENHKVLVVFSEPHAYISPTNYDRELKVPTWNYISVHAYGTGKIMTDNTQMLALIEKTIDNFEASFRKEWDIFPENYKQKMLNGIVAFEIIVDEIQASKKLSQDKTVMEQQKIIETLSQSQDTNERLIAEYMKNIK